MVKTTVQVEGMMCGMCEAHVNDAVRNAFQVKKVSSSRSKGTTEIISDTELDAEALTKAITDTGYKVNGITSVPYEKKGLFGK